MKYSYRIVVFLLLLILSNFPCSVFADNSNDQGLNAISKLSIANSQSENEYLSEKILLRAINFNEIPSECAAKNGSTSCSATIMELTESDNYNGLLKYPDKSRSPSCKKAFLNDKSNNPNRLFDHFSQSVYKDLAPFVSIPLKTCARNQDIGQISKGTYIAYSLAEIERNTIASIGRRINLLGMNLNSFYCEGSISKDAANLCRVFNTKCDSKKGDH